MKKLLILITALTAITAFAADGPITGFGALGNNLASGDWFTVVDISDTSASVNGTNKKILTSDVGLYYISDTAYSSAFNGVTDKGASKNSLYDYLHLGDADDDGKIDVLDLAAAGFPALDSAGALVASRSIAEGAAIDVTNGTGAAGNPTVAFDSTEVEATTWGAGANASNIWTFNLSGTDPIITLSSGVVNVSTGTLQQGGVDVVTTSGTQVFTNKTLDASATGNVVKFKSLPQFTSPLRVDGTGCTIGTTSTAVGYGLATFSNSADEAANYAQFRIIVPGDWDTAVTPRVRLCDMLGGADTNARRYLLGYASVAASALATTATGTAINVTVSADASGASGDVEFSNTGSYTDLTGWAPTPGQMLIITVARDGDNAADTSTVNSTLIALEIEYGVSQ